MTAAGVTRWRRKSAEVDMIRWDGSDEAWLQIANHGGLPERLPDGSVNIWVDGIASEANLDLGDWAVIDPGGAGVFPCKVADHAETYEPADDQVTVSRGQLVDALTRLNIEVPVSGPAAGVVDAESMADAILAGLVPAPASDHVRVRPPDLHRLVRMALAVSDDDAAFVERMRAASEAGP